MESIKWQYDAAYRKFRRVTFVFLTTWVFFYVLLAFFFWRITHTSTTLFPAGPPLQAEMQAMGSLLGALFLITIGVTVLRMKMQYALRDARKQYAAALKDILSIAREMQDTRGQVEAEYELRRIESE